MYDSIRVKAKLPLTDELKDLKYDWSNVEFQTKDLENCLLEYTINEDGTLTEHITEYEYTYYTPEERKKDKSLKPWNIVKEQKLLKEEHKALDYHGAFVFYCYEPYGEEETITADFKAYFSYGKLDKIELLKVEKSPSYSVSNKKWEEQRKLEEKKPWNRFKKYARYIGWRWFWSNTAKNLYTLSRGIETARMFIFKNML